MKVVKLVLIAFLVACPAAYIASDYWLRGFAYHDSVSWQVFVVAGVTTMAIAFATISYQTVKAALANPVESLRNE